MADSHIDQIRDWLERNRAELEAMRVGTLEIHWGDDVTYKLTRIERSRERAVRRLAG